jgi:hypothetical protein
MHDITTQRSREQELAWELLRDSPAVRMLAMTAGGVPAELSRLLSRHVQAGPSPGRTAESDRDYHRRRSVEERAAARKAAGPEARKAHDELAALYSGLWRPGRRSRSGQQQPGISGAAAVSSAERQDALLDEALRQTFPASDPVSVARIQ